MAAKAIAGEVKRSSPKRRIAISLTESELKQVEERAKKFSMDDARFCAYCVKFYLTEFGEEAALRPLKKPDQPRLNL